MKKTVNPSSGAAEKMRGVEAALHVWSQTVKGGPGAGKPCQPC